MKYLDESTTLLQLLCNYCGAEFEDEQSAIECINEALEEISRTPSKVIHKKVCPHYYETDCAKVTRDIIHELNRTEETPTKDIELLKKWWDFMDKDCTSYRNEYTDEEQLEIITQFLAEDQ